MRRRFDETTIADADAVSVVVLAGGRRRLLARSSRQSGRASNL